MDTPRTVHVVCNAHLDPVWLWSWRDGLDEVLNTSYYLCNLLDRCPDVIYTRGEAWVYEQVRKLDPALFERIRRHVEAGRWSLVGGWYIQPDCNLPSGFAMERQIALGQRLFGEFFGRVPRVGYNVDSFGHAAALPALLRAAGQPFYVMMRPGEAEMPLPARLFRWRGYAEGPEITVFRIAKAYTTTEGLGEEHVLAALSELPPGATHTMCFVGVGDHGGGPTEGMVEWCRAHRDAFPGWRLEFSSPERFFAAIEPEIAGLPLVVGELQQHAVGCYSVHRQVKLAVRQAEHRLIQAEHAGSPRRKAEITATLAPAWQRVCFHHFHDTLGGTCLPSAYRDVDAQLGQAAAIAEETAALAFRRDLLCAPDDPAQRLVFRNASDLAFSGYVEIEPWLEWTPWQPSWVLLDEHGQRVPFQILAAESAWERHQIRLLFHLEALPDATRTLRIVDSGEPAPPGGMPSGTDTPAVITVASGPALDPRFPRTMRLANTTLALPELCTYADATDTWSHGIDRYARAEPQTAVWHEAEVIDAGPLMTSQIQRGNLGRSEIQAEWRVYRDTPGVECLLRVLWVEQQRVLKLEWNLPGEIVEREDGIMGGSLARAADGRELPLRDWTRVRLNPTDGAAGFAVVAPDVFALDVNRQRIGLTLLRSCVLARHDPNPGTHPRSIHSDRGEHFFRFRFLAGEDLDAAGLDRAAIGWQRPLLSADFTRGMANRALRQEYQPPRITA